MVRRVKYLIIFFVFFVSGCGKSENSVDFFSMDTYITIKTYNTDKKYLDKAEEMFFYYEKLLDRFNDNELVGIYDINNMTNDIQVNDDLIELLTFANEMYVESNGLLDPAAGKLIDAWKNAANTNTLPSIFELELAYSSRKDIVIDNNMIINNGVFIDVGSIAKGYALRKIGEYFASVNVSEYLINAGGQVLVGNKYHEAKYKIGIKSPIDNSSFITVNAENECVSTSGGYERKFTVDSITYNHIINPKTLYPANYMQSVSVVTKDPLLADALTTILFLMPVEDGIEFIKNYDAEAVFYTNDNEIIKTEGFSIYEEN